MRFARLSPGKVAAALFAKACEKRIDSNRICSIYACKLGVDLTQSAVQVKEKIGRARIRIEVWRRAAAMLSRPHANKDGRGGKPREPQRLSNRKERAFGNFPAAR